MTKPLSFTQTQVKRAIAAAKAAGLRIVAIRPDGTVIVCDGEEQAQALRSALGLSAQTIVGNTWNGVLEDEWTPRT